MSAIAQLRAAKRYFLKRLLWYAKWTTKTCKDSLVLGGLNNMFCRALVSRQFPRLLLIQTRQANTFDNSFTKLSHVSKQASGSRVQFNINNRIYPYLKKSKRIATACGRICRKSPPPPWPPSPSPRSSASHWQEGRLRTWPTDHNHSIKNQEISRSLKHMSDGCWILSEDKTIQHITKSAFQLQASHDNAWPCPPWQSCHGIRTRESKMWRKGLQDAELYTIPSRSSKAWSMVDLQYICWLIKLCPLFFWIRYLVEWNQSAFQNRQVSQLPLCNLFGREHGNPKSCQYFEPDTLFASQETHHESSFLRCTRNLDLKGHSASWSTWWPVTCLKL